MEQNLNKSKNAGRLPDLCKLFFIVLVMAWDTGCGQLGVSGLPNVLAIYSVTPAQGSYQGGTAITIAGNGFTSSTLVTLGGQPCTQVTLQSNRQMTCTTSAYPQPEQVDVVVTNPGTETVKTDTVTLSKGFSYI